ncbi:putative ATPase [Dysgonomonas hofstadii]|uniref:Putative ATPase n=1 Tax=Dysgonomonas hofstadii TaxID=637886 RepID=A0A840CTU2_9BACT|nr:AAA family ATPase [Dysgonomonas hofstadii]MBB4035113.1 putative ATPase [Dysgonomonas hofstadii]
MIKSNFHIITGGPGVGKTTLLEELRNRGYQYIEEVARKIIKEQIAGNGDALPWANTRKYSDLMLFRSVDDFVQNKSVDSLLFFDRGIPDTYGYEVLINLEISKLLEEAVVKYRYNPTVFILPPWKEIYGTDNERKQDFDEATETYNVMCNIYKKSGYNVIDVPCLPVKERADFILSILKLT